MQADPEQTSWLSRNFFGIAYVLALLGIGARNEWTTRRMKRTMYNENEDLRLVLSSSCEKCRAECQSIIRADLTEIKSDVKMLIQHHMEQK
jgi:hypothetical protein